MGEIFRTMGINEWAGAVAIIMATVQVFISSKNFIAKVRWSRVINHHMAMECSSLNEAEKKVIKESLAQEKFRLIFGILANAEMRSAICQFVERSNGAVNSYMIKTVAPDIKYVDGKLKIEISKATKVMTKYYQVMTAISIVIGALMIFLAYVSRNGNVDVIYGFFFGIFFIFIAGGCYAEYHMLKTSIELANISEERNSSD